MTILATVSETTASNNNSSSSQQAGSEMTAEVRRFLTFQAGNKEEKVGDHEEAVDLLLKDDYMMSSNGVTDLMGDGLWEMSY